MVLSYDSYNEVLEKHKEKERELEIFKQKHDSDMKNIGEQINQMMKLIQQNPKLAKVKKSWLRG